MDNVLPLPSDALERALRRSQPLPVSEGALNRVITRLRKGLSLIVTAVGQSNTFGPGGCFGAGCAFEETARFRSARMYKHRVN